MHELLRGDKLQTISVNGLIEEMQKIDSTTNYKFESSTHDIMTIQDDVRDFVLKEARSRLEKVLDEPRFFQNQKAYLNAFLPATEKAKGFLTRINENDPSLALVE